ncbi:MAG: serine/threonine protein kinase [Oscillospiraceae bacterium]|nr:serine/threonine protein kinase [Oscillospiraceae bacterium]
MSGDGSYLKNTYKIEEKLGAGGNSEVYKVWHMRLRKFYVIKAHRAGAMCAAQVLRNEAEALKNLKSLYVPQVFDVLADEKTSYTIMEYIEGKSFDKLLRKSEKYERMKVIKWYYQLATALEEIHEKGVCHRDIKPSNIMLTNRGDICLIDFDSAIVTGKNVGIINRSLGYASPEQAQFFITCKKAHAKHIKRIMRTSYTSAEDVALKVAEPIFPYKSIDWKLSDIYSLGATMYHLLFGRQPPEEESLADKLIKITENGATLEYIIKRSLHSTPSKRFLSASDIKSAINKINQDSNIAAIARGL